MLSLENFIWVTVEPASAAERFKVTAVELVLRALLFIDIVPVGAAVSRIMVS